jgi:SAM-dependent methyltransferase
MSDESPFRSRWGEAPDAEWLEVLLRSVEQPLIDGVQFPAMPPPEMQIQIQGNSQRLAMRGAFAFYKIARDTFGSHGVGLNPDARLLDFGSGWGRMVRPYLRHFNPGNICAVEPHPRFCAVARQLNPRVGFVQSDPRPPAPFRDASFRYIVSYSVFTHLPPALFDAWLQEFWRILEPGGVAAFTFAGDRTMRKIFSEPPPPAGDWHARLGAALARVDPGGKSYQRGEPVFLPPDYGDLNSLYGDTLMNEDCVRRRLGSRWRILKIDSVTLAQDFCAIRKETPG